LSLATIEAIASASANWIGTTIAARRIVFQSAVPNFQWLAMVWNGRREKPSGPEKASQAICTNG
jgi:hypothetical protein